MNMFQLFGQTGMLYLFVSSLVYLSTTHAIHLANSPLNIDASLFLQKNVSIHHSVSKNDVNVVQALLSNDEPEPIVFEGFIQNSEGETDRVSSDVDTYTIFLPKLPDAVSANYQFYLDTANYFSFLPSKEDNTCEFTTTDYNAILTVDAGTPITNFFGKNGTRYIISPPNFISREIKLFRSGTSREGRLTCRMRTARAAGDFTQNAMKVTLSQHQLVTNQLILTETLINVGNISPHVYEANVPLALKNMAPTTPAAVFNIDDISYFDSEGNVDSKATISTVFPIFYSYYEESIPAGDYINVLLPIISLSMDTEYEFFISGVRISEDSYKPSYKYVFSSGDHLSETGELDSNGIRLVLVTIQLTKKIDFATIAAGGGAMIINGIPYITIRVTKARPLVDVIRRSFDFSKGGRFVASISSKDFHGQGYQYDYVRVISTNINAPSLPPVPMDVQVTASPDRAYAGKDNEYSFTFNIPENVCQGDSPYHFFELSLPSIIIPTFYVGLETDQTQSVTAIQRCNLYATSNPTVPLGVVSDVSISKMKINTNDDYLYVVTVDLTGQPSTKLSNVPHILKCTFTPGLRAFPAGIVARSHFIYRTNDYYDGSHCHAGQANLVFPAVEKPLSLPSSSDDYFGGIRSFALNYRNPYKATPTDSNDLFRVYFSPAHVSELQQRIELKMIPILTPTSKCIVLSRNGIEPLTIDTGITPTITGFDLTIAGIVTKSDLVIECTNLNNSSPYSFTT